MGTWGIQLGLTMGVGFDNVTIPEHTHMFFLIPVFLLCKVIYFLSREA